MFTILKEFFTTGFVTEDPKKNYSQEQFIEISSDLKQKIKSLNIESIGIRVVDCGSSNDCEHEIAALENPLYDFSRFGFKIVASPRHADCLLVTGPVTTMMKEALIKSYEASPEPKLVIALGDGAITGKIASTYSSPNLMKVSDCVPVDFEIPGNPPSPTAILNTLLSIKKIKQNG